MAASCANAQMESCMFQAIFAERNQQIWSFLCATAAVRKFIRTFSRTLVNLTGTLSGTFSGTSPGTLLNQTWLNWFKHGSDWFKLVQTQFRLETWLCTKAFRNLLRNLLQTFSGTLLNLTWLHPTWAGSGAGRFRRRFRRRGCGERFPGGFCAARSGSAGFRRRFRRRSVQSQIRFNRICSHLAHGNPAEVIPALGLAARFRQICKNKTLRLLGIPPKVIFFRERCVFNILTSKCASHRSGVQLSISHAARKLAPTASVSLFFDPLAAHNTRTGKTVSCDF